ncbi:HEAT repeat family protein [Histomonas meleagridis]|uniref:HEAT repeat family protein n=1 Tax=Histomonas meleagridis TaxID=135588 RepID=UPI00355A68DA|nr:HEAT repeat family protein [Histomonas meleagridis]KAH0799442.1 HEAT repeat family protein [Histomonas meleagridis]
MVERIKEELGSEDVNTRLGAISKISTIPEGNRAEIFNLVINDFNHEVREAAANQIVLCPSCYKIFLSDPDPKVRIAIIKHSIDIRKELKNDEDFFKSFEALQNDSVADVRRVFATVLADHAKADFGDKDKVVPRIVQLVERLLSDRHDDVRVAASLNVKQLTIQFGFDFVFEQLYNSLHKMLTDTQWRVRNNAVELLFGLAIVCNSDFFDQNLFPFLMQFLTDQCYKVREFALKALPTLVSHFGVEWLKSKLIVELQTLAQSQNFLQRETYLYCISALVSFFPVQYQSNYVFQPMIRMLRDPVQNVVLLAIELLQKHKESIHPFRRQYELKPILENLVESSPQTVKEHANAFLAECQ